MAEIKDLDQWQLLICTKEAYNQFLQVASRQPDKAISAKDLMEHLGQAMVALSRVWPYAEALSKLEATQQMEEQIKQRVMEQLAKKEQTTAAEEKRPESEEVQKTEEEEKPELIPDQGSDNEAVGEEKEHSE